MRVLTLKKCPLNSRDDYSNFSWDSKRTGVFITRKPIVCIYTSHFDSVHNLTNRFLIFFFWQLKFRHKFFEVKSYTMGRNTLKYSLKLKSRINRKTIFLKKRQEKAFVEYGDKQQLYEKNGRAHIYSRRSIEPSTIQKM